MKTQFSFSQAVEGYLLAANARHLSPLTIRRIWVGDTRYIRDNAVWAVPKAAMSRIARTFSKVSLAVGLLSPLLGVLRPLSYISLVLSLSVPALRWRGKIVFLNFWASWCAPCREEMPAMERLYQEFKDKNFVVFAVSVKDRKQDAMDFVKELKLSYPVASDPEGQVGLLYGAWGLPTTYLIGPKVEGLARAWGPVEWYGPAARKLIKELVDGKR